MKLNEDPWKTVDLALANHHPLLALRAARCLLRRRVPVWTESTNAVLGKMLPALRAAQSMVGLMDDSALQRAASLLKGKHP